MKNFLLKISRSFAAKKKIFSLFALACCSTLLSAQVGYLFPYSPNVIWSEVGNVYDYLPWEGSGHGEESPERKAYEWFNDVYTNADGKQFVTVKDVKDGALLSNGIPTVKVLWINVDKVGMSIEDYDAVYGNEDFISAIRNYVQAGGNVFLTKQATRIVSAIGRCSWWPDYRNGGYFDEANDQWNLTDNFCCNYNRHGHAMYRYMENYFDDWRFPLTHGDGQYSRTDNNNTWGDWNGYGIPEGGCDVYADGEFAGKNIRIQKFEAAQKCQILGGWGHTQGMDCAGFIEFFPDGDYKGTIVAMGLAAYQWSASNTAVYNVKNLTKGVLDYLSSNTADTGLAWNEETIPASGVINTTHIMTAHANAGYTIRYGADNPTVANIGDMDGNIYFNYFGDATFTATATGDGWTAPKNATATIHSATIPVNGGDQNVKYAYVLPYSLHTMSNYDNEEGLRPDFEAANWFYWQYVTNNIGCFVRPSDLGSLNSAIKVLWIHNDHVGKDSQEYYDDLGGDTFRENLRTFVNNGGNVFVSKQATRLIGDLGRNEFPQYQNGGYDNRGPWRVGNKWNLGGTEIDHSTHAVYANMGTNTEIMAGGRHTDNNCVWFNFDANFGEGDVQRLYHYQDDHNCRILGAWGHDAVEGVNGVLQNAGFVEYYPQTAGQGTIIAMGLAAFHWANPTELLKNFTRDILYYLNIDEAPGFVWIKEPQDGMVGTEQIAQVEHKDSELQWTSSNTEVVEIVDDPEHPGDKNYKKLLLKAAGEATITATRSGDGYKLPKNVKNTTFVTKTIHVTNVYTRSVTNGNYGTICLPMASTAIEGATMYRIADKSDTGITIEEVADMEAGTPYIFQASADEISVTMTGQSSEVKPANGLIGNLGATMTVPQETNNYVLSHNMLYQVDSEVTIATNRAYINMDGINPVAPAPGMRRRVIAVEHVATGNLTPALSQGEGGKVLRDGQLFILRDGKTYNAQGQIVK